MLLHSLLAIPATNPRFLEKGAQSAADGVFIDLEDAVVPELKVEARGKAIAALRDLERGDRVVSVRVNGLDTPWGVRDIVEVAEAGGTWDYAMARIANACRAQGLAPLDGPFFAVDDPEGLRAACRRAAILGYEGKMAIHPSQIEIANEVFSPTAQQLAWADEVLQAMGAAGSEGRGAVKTRDGKMIDLVHIKIARAILERGQRTANRR